MSTSESSLNRRQFLERTSGLSAALTLPALRMGVRRAQELPADITSMSASPVIPLYLR